MAEVGIEANQQRERARLREQAEAEAATNSRRQAELEAQLTALDDMLETEEENGANMYDEALAAVLRLPKHIMVQDFIQDCVPEEPARDEGDIAQLVKTSEDFQLNTNAAAFQPHVQSASIPGKYVQENNSEVAIQRWQKHFARRDLVTTVLVKFDDPPDNYMSWKPSFRSAIDGVQLSAREKLDLIVK